LGHVDLVGKVQLIYTDVQEDIGVKCVFFFFSLFTVSIRTRPGGSICVFGAGVPQQALHGDAHRPGKDALRRPVPLVPPALLTYSDSHLPLFKPCSSCLGRAAAGMWEPWHYLVGCTFEGRCEEALRPLLFESTGALVIPLGQQRCEWVEEPGEVGVAAQL